MVTKFVEKTSKYQEELRAINTLKEELKKYQNQLEERKLNSVHELEGREIKRPLSKAEEVEKRELRVLSTIIRDYKIHIERWEQEVGETKVKLDDLERRIRKAE